MDCFCHSCIAPFLPQTFSWYNAILKSPYSTASSTSSFFRHDYNMYNLCADWLELPGSLILLLVVAPSFFADSIRGHIVGTFICLVIGCYLLQEHIRASGGFRNSFTKSNGLSNSIGILLLFVYPVWALVLTLL